MAIRVEDIVEKASRQFRLLALVGAAELLCIAGLFAWWLDRSELWGVGVAIAFFFWLFVHDRGKLLTKRPRGMNTIKARNWAFFLYGALPVGPYMARKLRDELWEPVFVSYAVANHPDSGRYPDEHLLAVIRMRGSFVTMKNAGVILLGVGLVTNLAVFMLDDHTFWMTYGLGSGLIAALGLVQIVSGILGSRFLRTLDAKTWGRVRRASLMVAPVFPLGTYCAWAMMKAMQEVQATTPVAAPETPAS